MLQLSPNLTRHTRSACQNSGFQQSSESRTCSHPGTACKEREKWLYERCLVNVRCEKQQKEGLSSLKSHYDSW